VPPVGIHRKIADELDLKPGIVYQAIKTIRSEMGLPPYNDPELHAAEFEEIKRKAREAKEAREAAKAALATQASETGSEPQGTREETPNVQAVTATNEGEQVTE
jgi:transposase-like protein